MPTRFHGDESVDARILRGARQRGVDVSTTTEQGIRGVLDSEQAQRARELGRILVTSDTDFLREIPPEGLVFIRVGTDVGAAIRKLALFAQEEPVNFRGSIRWA